MTNKAQSALAGGFFIAAIYAGIFTTQSLPGAILTATPFLAVGEGIRRKSKASYPGALSDLLETVGEAVTEVSSATGKGAIAQIKPKKIIAQSLKRAGLDEQLVNRLVERGQLSTAWFSKLSKSSAMICGTSGSGKTYLLNYLLAQYLEENEGTDDLYILDQDYGRAHDGSAPNTWFDLPLGKVVFNDPQKILQVLRDINDFVDNAKGTGHPPKLVIFDEFSRTVTSYKYEDKEKEEIIQIVTNIVDRGKKVNVRVVLGAQTLAVGKSGLPTDLLNRLVVLLLHSSAQVERNYRNIDVEESQKSEVIEQMKRLPQVLENPLAVEVINSELRPCAVYQDGILSTGAIPKIDISNIEVTAPGDELTPEDELNRDWDSKQFSKMVGLLVSEAIATKKRPDQLLVKGWDLFGGNSSDRKNDNPYYVAFRSRLQHEVKSILSKQAA